MICDFPDLYDYGNESNGVGSYCLMCFGGILDPKNPHRIGALFDVSLSDQRVDAWACSSNALSAASRFFPRTRPSRLSARKTAAHGS